MYAISNSFINFCSLSYLLAYEAKGEFVFTSDILFLYIQRKDEIVKVMMSRADVYIFQSS